LFHPFGFGFEQVLVELKTFARRRKGGHDKCFISPTNIAQGFSEQQKKPGRESNAPANCRGDTTP